MSIPLPRPPSPLPVDLSSVKLQEGPPSRGELLKFYPVRYTWEQLKSIIESGDLSLLKRDPELRKRYYNWAERIAKEHGSVADYLVNVRLGWGPSTPPAETTSPSSTRSSTPDMSPIFVSHHEPRPEYFISTPSPDDVKIIYNDWPYSVPPEISHYVIWSRLPVIHPALVHPSVASQITKDGLWGFTGVPPQHTITDQRIYTDVAPGTSPSARSHILAASHHIRHFILAHWPETDWEVVWFVNPPRLQSVKDLSHIHAFTRRNQPTFTSGRQLNQHVVPPCMA